MTTNLMLSKHLPGHCALRWNMTPVKAPQNNGCGSADDLAGESETLPYLDHYVAWWRLYHNGFAAAKFICGVHTVNITITVEGLRDTLIF